MMGHEEVRVALGAYAVGALEPGERPEVERHLATCPSCRAELAALAPLPGLLSRLDREATLGGARVELDPALADRLVAAVATERRTERRTLRRWRAMAALAAAAAVLLGALAVVSLLTRPGGGRGTAAGPGSRVAGPGAAIALQVVDPAAGSLNGTVRADPKGWGASLELQLWDLPDRPQFALMVVGRDGRREQAAAWSVTPAGQCLVTGATSIQATDIDHFEVVVPGGPVLAQAEV